MSPLDLIGPGIYTITEASRLTGVSTGRIRRWASGYVYQYKGRVRRSEALWEPRLPVIDGELALSFLDLMEVRIVDAFRRSGVGWKAIRRAAKNACRLLGVTRPFCSQRFKTDGRTIFAEVLKGERDESLLDLVKSQYAFQRILAPYLYEGIDFATQTGEPLLWWPRKRSGGVVLDPARQFGKPIVADEGVPTAILKAAVDVEQSPQLVAELYEVSTRSVRQAVAFEEELERRAA